MGGLGVGGLGVGGFGLGKSGNEVWELKSGNGFRNGGR